MTKKYGGQADVNIPCRGEDLRLMCSPSAVLNEDNVHFSLVVPYRVNIVRSSDSSINDKTAEGTCLVERICVKGKII